MSDNFKPASPVLTASWALARRIAAAELADLYAALQTITLDIALIPPYTNVRRTLVLVNGQAAGVTTLLLSLGFDPNGGGPYEDYLSQHDLVNDAAGALISASPTLNSNSVPCGAIPSLTAETSIKAVLTCSTGAETFATLTGLDISIYFECVVLPS